MCPKPNPALFLHLPSSPKPESPGNSTPFSLSCSPNLTSHHALLTSCPWQSSGQSHPAPPPQPPHPHCPPLCLCSKPTTTPPVCGPDSLPSSLWITANDISRKDLNVIPLLLLFIQQIFTEHLLTANHSLRWRFFKEQNNSSLVEFTVQHQLVFFRKRKM